MAENLERDQGRPKNYKLDRGGVPAEFGPFMGKVMNNIDPTRSGRLQVYIEAFGDGAEDSDDNKWTTVSYLPPFYGVTPTVGTSDATVGGYPGNQNSYGMWFTPPDLGMYVICVFVDGDRNKGYYIGGVPENGLNHMIPAVGAESNYIATNANQEAYFDNAELMPVTEINTNNNTLDNAGRFFDQDKPIQSVIAAALFQQGLAKDTERGPIRSSSQRESPSACFGISTPGTAVYQGGLQPKDALSKLNSGEVKPQDLQVIARMGGHTLVMDDGDIEGDNQLFRLRTAKGHQIMMNDTDNFVYIVHANGQTWIELGVEGTVDIFSTNSVNVRTQGDINLHADRDINMWAGRDIKMHARQDIVQEADRNFALTAQNDLKVYSKGTLYVKADGTLGIQSSNTTWQSGSQFTLTASGIDLNGPAAPAVTAPTPLVKNKLDATKFNSSRGWVEDPGSLESICNRAPTHEPWPYHNLGVDVKIELEPGQPATPPATPPIPAGVKVKAL
jgi:hypothetical protein|nr:hypothetical protein [Oxalobacteraceae bacterium]